MLLWGLLVHRGYRIVCGGRRMSFRSSKPTHGTISFSFPREDPSPTLQNCFPTVGLRDCSIELRRYSIALLWTRLPSCRYQTPTFWQAYAMECSLWSERDQLL